jgi:hypothetical protein
VTRRALSRTNGAGWWFRLLFAATLLSACGSASLDAGSDHPHGPLPVDERNPVLVSNDGPHDNWQGEFAMAMASAGDMQLAGIIVNATVNYPSIDSNMQGWRAMAAAARASGMRNIPDPIASIAPVLERPPDGNIDETAPNRSEGALLILDTARRLSRPLRPIVVATGGELTDIADAYLIDHSVVDQVVVVSSLGHTLGTIAKIIAGGQTYPLQTTAGAIMNWPNGDLDPWADEIVARKFRYVQVNAYYPQQDDITPALATALPANAFGGWIKSKIPAILSSPVAADQNSVIASIFPHFALDVFQASAGSAPSAAGQVPSLSSSPSGNVWVIRRGDNDAATVRFWQVLKDPATFGK